MTKVHWGVASTQWGILKSIWLDKEIQDKERNFFHLVIIICNICLLTFPAFNNTWTSDLVKHVLVNDPVGLNSLRGLVFVENQWCFISDHITLVCDWLLSSCTLPVSTPWSPVWRISILILVISGSEKIPLFLVVADFKFLCSNTTTLFIKKINEKRR